MIIKYMVFSLITGNSIFSLMIRIVQLKLYSSEKVRSNPNTKTINREQQN